MTFLNLLGLLFIGLKLAGVIEWAWLLVLSPLIIPWGIALLFVISGIIVAAITK